jgi:hypothetical protein
MLTKPKLAIFSGILSIVALSTTSLTTSAFAQNNQEKYGFTYRHNASKMWHFMWGYNSRQECDNAEESFRKLNGSGSTNSSGNYQEPLYSIIYYCHSGERKDFQDDVDAQNRR